MLWKTFLEDADLLMQGYALVRWHSSSSPLIHLLHSLWCCTWLSCALPLPGVVLFIHLLKSQESINTFTFLMLYHNTAVAGILYSPHIAGHDSWLSLLAASYWNFSLVLLVLLLLPFLSFLKLSWQDYLFRMCPLTSGVVKCIPKNKPQALKCRLSKLALLWTKYSLFIIF